jgi:hypothetical protein
MESQVTAELMKKKGVNNVRGSMFSQPKLYTMDDLEQLVGFLGHYNDLNYKEIRENLEQTLPKGKTSKSSGRIHLKSKQRKRRKKVQVSVSGKRCYKCGR